MKKLISILFVMLMLFSITACDNSSNKQFDKIGGEVDNFTINITNAYLAKDGYGYDWVVLEYEFTNNDTSEKSFGWNVTDRVYQNDIELDREISNLSRKDLNPNDDFYRGINPGVTLSGLQAAYKLRDKQSELTVELSQLHFLYSSDPLVLTISMDDID